MFIAALLASLHGVERAINHIVDTFPVTKFDGRWLPRLQETEDDAFDWLNTVLWQQKHSQNERIYWSGFGINEAARRMQSREKNEEVGEYINHVVDPPLVDGISDLFIEDDDDDDDTSVYQSKGVCMFYGCCCVKWRLVMYRKSLSENNYANYIKIFFSEHVAD